MLCLECKQLMHELPIYNIDDENFPPSILFCNNPNCIRFGLLTVTFTNEEEDKKDSDKGV